MYQCVFIMEQVLGHIAYGNNLKRQIASSQDIDPHWLPVAFPVSGVAAHLPGYGSNWTVRAGFRTRQSLAKVRTQTNPDVLFFHTQVTGVLAQDWVERYPSVVSLDATPILYDTLGDLYHHYRGPRVIEQWKQWMNARLFHKAQALVTWSDWARNSLIADYQVSEEKVTVIRPGIDLTLWQPDRRILSQQNRVRILFVGGDLLRKGGAVLLEAFRALRQRLARLGQEDNLELHMVTKTQIKAEPGVFIYSDLGPNDPRLINLYHTCDLFVLPTFGDCLGVALLEAAAAGLPVITTRVGAIPEIVISGETGILIPPGDLAALTAALVHLVEEPALRLRMGIQALELARQEFDGQQTTVQLLTLLRAVADQNRGGVHG